MNRKTTVFSVSALAAGALLSIAAPLSASAHISADPSETAAGSFSVITFALPHGCEGSATTSMRIGIPEGVVSVTPTVNPNWTVAEEEVDLEAPVADGEGAAVTSRTAAVVYTAVTPMPDGLRDTFALSLPIPADAAGKTLEFPVTQTCEKGETQWDESTVAGEAEPEHPAPAITVTGATGDDHGHGTTATASDVHEAAGATAAGSGDVLARVLGVGGLAVAAVGVVLAVTARRRLSA
ncbi:MAG: YcnI family protein [Cryobacterium sp.]